MNKLIFGGILLLVISCNSVSVKENKFNESKSVLSKIKQMDWIIGKWENIQKMEVYTKYGQKPMILFIQEEVL